MRNILFISVSLVFCAVLSAQNTYILDVNWDGGSSPLNITQEIRWTNTSDVNVDKITLLDWNHAYASERSPLGEFLANEFDYKLIRANKKNRGYTIISEIRHNKNNLSWKRLPDAIDIIEVTLPEYVVPKATFSFVIRYTVKLPNASIFKYGISKKEIHAKHWHLVLASQYPNGNWIKDSNLGLGKPNTIDTKISYRLHVPKKINTILPIQNNSDYSPLLLTTKDTYMRITSGKYELISDMLPNENLGDFNDTLTRISAFIQELFPSDQPQVLLAFQKDYSQKPLLSLESMPKFVDAFDKNQVVELKLLKAILEEYIQSRFINQPKDAAWITEGLPYFLWQQYVNSYYPDLKMTGSLSNWPIIKKHHFTQAPYYRSWEITANVSANKNRGQSLVTPQNELTRYNRRLANPYRAALALLYLESYLGDNTVLEAIKTAPKSNRLDVGLKNELKTKTDKPIDWFFDHYVHQNNNSDLSLLAKKVNDGQFKITISDTQKNTVIPLTVIKPNGEENTLWIPNDNLPYEDVFDKKTTKSLILNKTHFIPELKLNNNSYNLGKKIFRNNLRLRLFQDIPQSGTSVLLLTPELGYNVYDGLLAGLRVGNSSLLNNNFKFKLSPQIGTKSTQANGMGYVVGSLYHNKKSHYLTRFTLFGSSYHYAQEKRYSSFSPSIQFYFRPNGIQQNDRTFFLIRHISVLLEDLPKDDNRRNYGVSLASFQSKSGNALQNISYKTELQWANTFKKISAESEYITYYLPNRRATFRVFAGGFLKNKSNDNYFDYNSSRVNDYLFQYDLYGRSETEGFFSQQYIKAEGALRTAGNVKSSNKWLITAQSSITLWQWIEGYVEIGWIKNSKQKTHTHWGTGVSFNLIPDFFEIHFPLYDATGNLMSKRAYPKQIRFQLSLKPSSLVQLFSRSWF